MKTQLLTTMMVAGLMATQALSLHAQTVSTFENLTLTPNSYWDGESKPFGTTFSSGNAILPNYYDTAFSGYWSSGWAYSNMKDSTTAGFVNMYSARPAVGYNSSANYAIGQQGAKIILTPAALGKAVNGLYVTNGTYAAISMRDGDGFAKKFGGTSGNDPDWFKLTIRKWLGGIMTNDSVEFYLADYRFANNAQDYIVKTWQWVDLTSLGNIDSLKFILSSSDVGIYGMNTPAFFCMDNFTTPGNPLSVQNADRENNLFSVFPNPAKKDVSIDVSKISDKNLYVILTDLTGKFLHMEKINSSDKISLDVSNCREGIYFINIKGENTFISTKLVKE